MMKKTMIFLDGKIVKADHRLIESLNPGVVRGQGVFETMKILDGKILFLKEHFGRMARGLKFYKIKMPYSLKKIKEYLGRTVQANHLNNARVRLAVWKEGGRVKVSIVCQPLGSGYGKLRLKRMNITISSIKRPKTRCSHLKSLDYHVFREALRAARNKGFDEAILLNKNNELVEGATTNIFLIQNNVLYTPAIRCGCLNGVTRKVILRCARDRGIPFKVTSVPVEQLYRADEVFLTNSLLGIGSGIKVDGKRVGAGIPGPVTGELAKAYQESIRKIMD